MKQHWMIEAERHIGQKEIAGAKSNPWILNLWFKFVPWLGKPDDSAVPWCGTFIAHCLKNTGHVVPKAWYRALAWLDWGQRIENPVVGCIVVFSRKGGGHVGFVVGKNRNGNLMVLGGNQGDAVAISAFDKNRVVGYRWPSDAMIPISVDLPLITIAGKLSENEA